MFKNDTFFEIVTTKVYGEIHNYSVTPWIKEDTSEDSTRTMHYEFPKTIAFAKYTVAVDQVQKNHSWSVPGTQCYIMFNLRHLKRRNIFGNFNDIKQF